jgi:hypothetical protein
MNYDNIIPLGDHCSPSIILKELNLRKKSYPFDWTNHAGGIFNTNLYKNFFLLLRLLKFHDFSKISQFYVGNAMKVGNHKTNNGIQFPHDLENNNNTIEKYKRRFERMYNDIVNKSKNLYIIIIRKVLLKEEKLNEIIKELLYYNKESKIIIFFGNIENQEKYIGNKNIIMKYIPFIEEFGLDYDVNFRENIKNSLKEIINC